MILKCQQNIIELVTRPAVTQNGVAKTTGHTPGETSIVASMNRATHNKGQAKILVTPALAVTLAPGGERVLEAQVGSDLHLPVAFYADKAKATAFTKCHHLPYKLATSGEETKTFDIVNPRAEKRSGESGPGCSSVHLKAVSTGFARLALIYTYTNLDGKTSVALKDNVHVAAYETLSPIQVGSLIYNLYSVCFL